MKLIKLLFVISVFLLIGSTLEEVKNKFTITGINYCGSQLTRCDEECPPEQPRYFVRERDGVKEKYFIGSTTKAKQSLEVNSPFICKYTIQTLSYTDDEIPITEEEDDEPVPTNLSFGIERETHFCHVTKRLEIPFPYELVITNDAGGMEVRTSGGETPFIARTLHNLAVQITDICDKSKDDRDVAIVNPKNDKDISIIIKHDKGKPSKSQLSVGMPIKYFFTFLKKHEEYLRLTLQKGSKKLYENVDSLGGSNLTKSLLALILMPYYYYDDLQVLRDYTKDNYYIFPRDYAFNIFRLICQKERIKVLKRLFLWIKTGDSNELIRKKTRRICAGKKHTRSHKEKECFFFGDYLRLMVNINIRKNKDNLVRRLGLFSYSRRILFKDNFLVFEIRGVIPDIDLAIQRISEKYHDIVPLEIPLYPLDTRVSYRNPSKDNDYLRYLHHDEKEEENVPIYEELHNSNKLERKRRFK